MVTRVDEGETARDGGEEPDGRVEQDRCHTGLEQRIKYVKN